jgi:hypothetical protein
MQTMILKVFMPLVLQRFYKNELLEIEQETQDLLTFKNFYFMKKVMILSGLSTAGTFMLGSVCKVMHWPGASFFFVLAIGLLEFSFSAAFVSLETKGAKINARKIGTYEWCVGWYALYRCCFSISNALDNGKVRYLLVVDDRIFIFCVYSVVLL